jgi:hypothetical protein
MLAMARYQMSPGEAATRGEHVSPATQITCVTEKPTLIMFLHPQCPCSAASVEELARLMAKCGERVRATVFVSQPNDKTAEWTRGSLWRAASAIPGVSVEPDPGNTQAIHFGARTSGQVLLHNTHGKLLYAGGITGSRGHAGDNGGLDALTQLLLHPDDSPIEPAQFAVFGCALTPPGQNLEVTR